MKSLLPGQGPRRCTHFPYCSTPKGSTWHAHVAGPAVWIAAHGKSRTTICAEWFTDGAVPCSHCTLGELAHVVGYVPLYREVDARPCMVLVYEDVRHNIDALRLHERVLVGRAKDATATAYVISALVQEPRYKTTLRERQQPADISRSLLAVWRHPEVTSWYLRTHPATASGPALAAMPTMPAPARQAPLAAALHSPPPPPPPAPAPRVDAVPMDDALTATMERLRRKAAKNGKPDVTGG